ncbi:hypothetical protein MHB54_15835 [Paenibacillus sp. FSL M7-0802]|nr:hypothetical protein [Paenibacillus polymyxa]
MKDELDYQDCQTLEELRAFVYTLLTTTRSFINGH